MKYALFLGCTVPVRGMNYEIAARKVADRIGLHLVDVDEFTCCGFPVKAVDVETSFLMAARNLALAENRGLDICTLCSACTSTLTEVNKVLKEDEELREIINEKLGNIRYNGNIEVKHFSRILYEDLGICELKNFIVEPLEGFRFAPHYGCHYLKPSEVYEEFDNPEAPVSLDELIMVTGAESVDYTTLKNCCGGGILGIDENVALKMSAKKLMELKDKGIDGLISICPFCSIMYEGNQKKIEKMENAEIGIPVFYYPQILGLALGIPADELGFKLNRVKPKAFLEKLGA
ncbi:MAG TPA: disulfide reductase [candidate division WOR-3 bacterium]|uniref:Disulfide reductase n=1 Tax=candidate division WOR-3 bacterium TaxID=2052148 RepID=A0A7C0ZA04_UNCW3|nr:disulfide reductase [candidate division WOR-3 bacterium]